MNRIIPNMIFLSFCILYLFQSINLSQNQNLEFEHITIDHGLSNSDVHDIIQDSLGFLWIATEDGFNKYDGYKFTVYKHDPDNPFSLSHNSTYRLLNSYIEGRQIIWIGTFGGGLNAFDVKTERFIHWKKIEQNKSWDSKNNSFCSVLYDKVTKEYKMWYTESVRKIGLAVIKLNKSINWIDWKKYPLNPILSDSIFLSTPTVIYHNGTYHMWYSGYFADKGFSIGYASSPDGIKWTKYINNPVLKSGGIGGWIGENCLLYPNVVHDGKQFHMWYSGYDVNWEVSEIGHAISKDGINWKKDRKNPVLRRGQEGNWDEYLTSSASVIFNNDRFHLWYRGKGSTYREWSKFGYATSLDGSNWLKYHEPVFTSVTGFESDLWHLNVIYDGSNYQMFYTEGWIDNFILRHAESKDGVNWERTSDNRIWKKANSGLTTNNVISLCMDNRGALWVGTSQNPGGLNKFTLPSKSEFECLRKIKEKFQKVLKIILLESILLILKRIITEIYGLLEIQMEFIVITSKRMNSITIRLIVKLLCPPHSTLFLFCMTIQVIFGRV